MTEVGRGGAVRVPSAKVALSTASCYPESCTAAFELAAHLGYDAIEVMVWTDPVSQDSGALRRLSEHYAMPVLAIHAPCLLVTQRVWHSDPWVRLERSLSMAVDLGASTVVLHPPFRWQREYARQFVSRIATLQDETHIKIAIENMYPWRMRGREVAAYLPSWDPTTEEYRHFTLDLSHAAVSGTDALAMLEAMGERLAHLHLADGSGSNRDEHLVPGHGAQPCAAVLERLAGAGFGGAVVLEVNTRRAPSRAAREEALAEALAFTRLNLAVASGPAAKGLP